MSKKIGSPGSRICVSGSAVTSGPLINPYCCCLHLVVCSEWVLADVPFADAKSDLTRLSGGVRPPTSAKSGLSVPSLGIRWPVERQDQLWGQGAPDRISDHW